MNKNNQNYTNISKKLIKQSFTTFLKQCIIQPKLDSYIMFDLYLIFILPHHFSLLTQTANFNKTN